MRADSLRLIGTLHRSTIGMKVDHQMKLTEYFHAMHRRPDRVYITFHWIQRVIDHPISEVVQTDGRIRRWAPIAEMDGRYLRVVLLSDGETVHNAFFDRGFKP